MKHMAISQLRRRLAAAALGAAAASASSLGLSPVPAAADAPVTFNTPGVESQYKIPNQAGTLQVMAVGAPGGPGANTTGNSGGTAGRGGVINVTLTVAAGGAVAPGTIVYIEVGGGEIGRAHR